MLDDTTTGLGGPPAGFWRRFGAALIDGIVVGVPSWIVQIAVNRGLGYLVGIVLGCIYFTYFHGRTGQTPGDAALSIRVVDERNGTGQPIGHARALGRWAMSYVSGVVIVLGFLWMLWDPKKQTWHDKAVGSLPVYVG